MLDNLLLPSIVGERPELSQNGLRLWDHYYFEFGPSYALADEGTLGHYQVRGSGVRSWLRPCTEAGDCAVTWEWADGRCGDVAGDAWLMRACGCGCR